MQALRHGKHTSDRLLGLLPPPTEPGPALQRFSRQLNAAQMASFLLAASSLSEIGISKQLCTVIAYLAIGTGCAGAFFLRRAARPVLRSCNAFEG